MSPISRRSFLFSAGAALGAGCAADTGRRLAPDPAAPPAPDDSGGGFAEPPPGRPDAGRIREALAEARSVQTTRLRAYREAGEFPQNHRVLGHTPVFVDAHGTPCAVGYLMLQSGERDLVRRVARNDNHVYLETVRDGPVLEWILASGLTQEEAAYIQPSYDHIRPPDPAPDPLELQRERLVRHFLEVERALLRESNRSLDVATDRLLARMSS